MRHLLLLTMILFASALFSSCATSGKTYVNGVPGSKKYINSIGMAFVYIPPGSFMMGSPSDEPGRWFNEKERQHRVTLTKGFYMQTTEVTQDQWFKIMGTVPSHFKGKNNPVEYVSWDDAQTFIRKLNAKEGTTAYRLPTEAEWEYACRAGTTTPFYTGKCLSSTTQANYNGSKARLYDCPNGISRKETVPVKRFPSNAWGLYNMHGNVMEWCSDWTGDYPSGSVVDPAGPSSGKYRVVRGGCFGRSINGCRSAYRGGNQPEDTYDFVGFRLVRSSVQ